ncbi:unnamed protein product [Somion occarium]|uniref:Nudix hydrolase domain-containing protein n=1 Tax=Somion occarium TaxID=3059160 RepID=A0ABP1EAS9_9APHY
MGFDIPPSALDSISSDSRKCIERLKAHQLEKVDISGRPSSRLAAVLVLLYEESGKLRVLLTTRSKSLRSHPGQTALPGGKVDDVDVDVIQAAYREANEEVGLPLDSPHIHTVCLLRPYTSSSRLLVTPVVALLTDTSILRNLTRCEDEVDRIFDHPLEAMLDPSLASEEPLVKKGSEDWLYKSDYHNFTDILVPWIGNSGYRMHRFRSSASPIKGLTAEILIMTAAIAYDRLPVYEHYAPNQLTKFKDILRYLDAEHAPNQSGTSTPIGISAHDQVLTQ